MASLNCSILKVFMTYLTYSFFRKFWYHVICLGHKLWLQQARSFKWLAVDMILLKETSRNLSCTIFILENPFQVFLIVFGDNSWYRWNHTWLSLSVVYILKVFMTYLSYSFSWKVCCHVICLAHQSWLRQVCQNFTLVRYNARNRQVCTYGYLSVVFWKYLQFILLILPFKSSDIMLFV